MKKILMIILALIFCNTAYAENGNFNFDLTKAEGIKLLTGEKQIAMLFKRSSSVRDKLTKDVASDIKLKLRLIGMEFSEYKWGVPLLIIHLNILDVGDNRYSGRIALSFEITANYSKKILSYSTVWEDSSIFSYIDEQGIRNSFKDCMDRFLNVYLEANPRKFIEEKQTEKDQ